MSRMWALEESASAQKAARLHTDAALQHGIKMPGTAPLPRLLQVRQRQCKMFPKISMGTSAVWRESGLNVTERSATQEFVCCCHAAWLQASAKSASHHQSCPPRFAALCKQKTVWIRQNIMHSRATLCALSCCAYLICLFFSVCLLRLLLRFKISSLKD